MANVTTSLELASFKLPVVTTWTDGRTDGHFSFLSCSYGFVAIISRMGKLMKITHVINCH